VADVDSGWGGVAMTTGLPLPIAILKLKKRSKKHLLRKHERFRESVRPSSLNKENMQLEKCSLISRREISSTKRGKWKDWDHGLIVVGSWWGTYAYIPDK
jgi:hypothetical protein